MTTFQRQGVFLNSKEGPIETPQPTQECPRWLAILSYLRGGDWQKHESAHFPFFLSRITRCTNWLLPLCWPHTVLYTTHTHTLFICVFSSFHFFLEREETYAVSRLSLHSTWTCHQVRYPVAPRNIFRDIFGVEPPWVYSFLLCSALAAEKQQLSRLE